MTGVLVTYLVTLALVALLSFVLGFAVARLDQATTVRPAMDGTVEPAAPAST